MEKHQGNYHPTFLLHLQDDCHRKVVICSALLTYVWPIALAHGLPVPHWLLLWRLWLRSLSLDCSIIPASLQFSQDFCFFCCFVFFFKSKMFYVANKKQDQRNLDKVISRRYGAGFQKFKIFLFYTVFESYFTHGSELGLKEQNG